MIKMLHDVIETLLKLFRKSFTNETPRPPKKSRLVGKKRQLSSGPCCHGYFAGYFFNWLWGRGLEAEPGGSNGRRQNSAGGAHFWRDEIWMRWVRWVTEFLAALLLMSRWKQIYIKVGGNFRTLENSAQLGNFCDPWSTLKICAQMMLLCIYTCLMNLGVYCILVISSPPFVPRPHTSGQVIHWASRLPPSPTCEPFEAGEERHENAKRSKQKATKIAAKQISLHLSVPRGARSKNNIEETDPTAGENQNASSSQKKRNTSKERISESKFVIVLVALFWPPICFHPLLVGPFFRPLSTTVGSNRRFWQVLGVPQCAIPLQPALAAQDVRPKVLGTRHKKRSDDRCLVFFFEDHDTSKPLWGVWWL